MSLLIKLGVASLMALGLISCCKAICEDSYLTVYTRGIQAVDTDTVYLIRYKPNTGFIERTDSIKRFTTVPAASTVPSSFIDNIDYHADWKIVIPALNREYFISNIEVQRERCQCEGGTYGRILKFRLNNIETEGNQVVLQ